MIKLKRISDTKPKEELKKDYVNTKTAQLFLTKNNINEKLIHNKLRKLLNKSLKKDIIGINEAIKTKEPISIKSSRHKIGQIISKITKKVNVSNKTDDYMIMKYDEKKKTINKLMIKMHNKDISVNKHSYFNSNEGIIKKTKTKDYKHNYKPFISIRSKVLEVKVRLLL